MRRALPFVIAAAVLAVVVVGLLQARGADEETAPFRLQDALAQLEGAPAPLAALHAQPSELVEGGFEARLKELRGHPVVVNKWASWCGPCRAEFPIFQRLSARLGKEVGFLGLNSLDNRQAAEAFLDRYPVPFPSYFDPRHTVAQANGMGGGFPTTSFYDATGRRRFVHQGQYRSQADLLADVEKYAR